MSIFSGIVVYTLLFIIDVVGVAIYIIVLKRNYLKKYFLSKRNIICNFYTLSLFGIYKLLLVTVKFPKCSSE